jgi:Flp pilus assembly protein TadD
MVVLEPGMVPDTAEPSRYFNAVVALEKHNPASVVSKAYASGLQLWPDDRELLMGYGNLHYARQDSRAAQLLFEKVTVLHPDYAPAYNNLAQVEFELGNLDQAEILARQAVALGGKYLAGYQETLDAILEHTH